MKKLALLAFLSLATPTFADELHTFDEIKTAIVNGKSIRIAIDFSKCARPNNEMLPASYAIGAFTPNEIIIDNTHGRITTSLLHFTLKESDSSVEPMFQFVKYIINPSNNITVTSQLLDSTTYKPIKNKLSFDCKLDSGARIFS